MTKIARFLGDPTRYTLHPDDDQQTGWVRARIELSTREVRVNLTLAYVIEEKPDVPWVENER